MPVHRAEPFYSLEFLLFFLTVFCVHWLLPPRWRPAFLLTASYAFYAYWDPRHLPLLGFITFVSWFCAIRLSAAAGSSRRNFYLALALAAHLISLFVYTSELSLGGLIPLGFSFYALQSLGYVVDVYRGLPPEAGLVNHGLFVSLFPLIVAGPIERAKRLLPQIKEPSPFQWARLRDGCDLVFYGLFQKIFIADNLARTVRSVFEAGAPPPGSLALLGVYAFAFQLFCDFNGYSSIARGLGKCLGFELIDNFNAPFFATDVRDFWKRWHISFTSWLSDYVFRPLLELRWPFFKLYGAALLTMVAMGLWHGARPTMLFVGLYSGIVIVASLFILSRTPERTPSPSPWTPWLHRLLTFHLACGGFLLFRADSMAQAKVLLCQILFHFAPGPEAFGAAARILFFAWPMIIVESLRAQRGDALAFLRGGPASRATVYASMACLLILFGNHGSPSYIYSFF